MTARRGESSGGPQPQPAGEERRGRGEVGAPRSGYEPEDKEQEVSPQTRGEDVVGDKVGLDGSEPGGDYGQRGACQ
jgi:hypothetical protein